MTRLGPPSAALFALACFGCGDLSVGIISESKNAELGPEARRTTSPFEPLGTQISPVPFDPPSSLTSVAESPAVPCGPSVGGPYWLEEGETLIVRIACATGALVHSQALEVSPLPFGADFDRGQKELRWTPGLDQAGVYELLVSVPGSTERATLKIGVADRHDNPKNKPIGSPEAYTEEMGLPVFHLTLAPELNADAHTPARLSYRGRSYAIEAKHRGRSSLAYPKKSFTLKFDKKAMFSEPLRAGGFLNKRRVALISTFDDNSYVRQRLAYEVWNRLGSIRIQTYSAVVYVNGVYQGIYVAADAFDENLIEQNGLPGTGNLYKAIDHDSNFRTDVPLGEVFEQKEGAPAEGQEAFADLMEMIDFVANSDDQTFRAKVNEKLDLRDYSAWLISVTAMQATDTLAKNSYHYHNPNDGLWKVAPWDFNASWGQSWDSRREGPSFDPLELARLSNKLFARLVNDEVLGPRLRDRYAEALANQISYGEVSNMFEAAINEVAQATGRDERRWRKEYLAFERWSDRTDFTNFEGEADYVRKWIKDRWAFLAERF